MIFVSWNGNNSEAFRNVTEEIFAEQFGNEIYLSVPHHVEAPVESIVAKVPQNLAPKLAIVVWSSPVLAQQQQSPPEKMWGIEVSCRDSMFAPPEGAYLHTLKDGEILVAGILFSTKVNTWCIYIHHDIVHYGNSKELWLYRMILEKAKEYISCGYTPPSQEEMLGNLMNSKTNERIKALRDEVAAHAKDIADYQHGLARSIARNNAASHQLAILLTKAFVNKNLVAARRLLASTCKIKDVKSVVVGHNKVQVRTGMINFVVNDETFQAGEFEITYNFEDSCVSILNETRQIKAHDNQMMQHPHVFADCSPCFGNVSQTIAEALGNYQIDVLTIAVINFLKSADPEDAAGEYYRRWPKVLSDGSLKEYSPSDQDRCQNCYTDVDSTCNNCGNCDDCCSCSFCGSCGEAAEYPCSNCNRCESCCPCSTCRHCVESVSSVCSECERCEECCSCYHCENCGTAFSDSSSICNKCERCSDCVDSSSSCKDCGNCTECCGDLCTEEGMCSNCCSCREVEESSE